MSIHRIALILLLAATEAPCEELQHELLVFGKAEIVRTDDVDPPATDLSDEEIAADVIFSVQRGPLRLFGEYLLSNQEQELERFQIGWEPTENSLVWLGRFHQASSFWNHHFHHGQYLQTSITRPVIEDWEDEGGVIPQHFTGLQFESTWRLPNGWGLRAALGCGVAPKLTEEGLEPYDLLNPTGHGHQLGYQARLGLAPDEISDAGAGILLAHNEINAPDDASSPLAAPYTHVDQSLFGLYGSYRGESWQIFGAGYYVAADLVGPSSRTNDDDFIVGYLQAEKETSHGLELFARLENSANTQHSAYLDLFPNFVTARTSIGVRWEFVRRHALSLQLSDSHAALDDFKEIYLQWSAALL